MKPQGPGAVSLAREKNEWALAAQLESLMPTEQLEYIYGITSAACKAASKFPSSSGECERVGYAVQRYVEIALAVTDYLCYLLSSGTSTEIHDQLLVRRCQVALKIYRDLPGLERLPGDSSHSIRNTAFFKIRETLLVEVVSAWSQLRNDARAYTHLQLINGLVRSEEEPEFVRLITEVVRQQDGKCSVERLNQALSIISREIRQATNQPAQRANLGTLFRVLATGWARTGNVEERIGYYAELDTYLRGCSKEVEKLVLDYAIRTSSAHKGQNHS